LSAAQAYAYGGSIIQDRVTFRTAARSSAIWTHYVRSARFCVALCGNAQNVYDYAFALGALSHYATDNRGIGWRRIARYHIFTRNSRASSAIRDL